MKKKINLLALGDVGSTLLMGLKLLGGEDILEIGIHDISENVMKRWESEMNQVYSPEDLGCFPAVTMINERQLFDCDVFIFCASKGVPAVGSQITDVRMAQLEGNRKIVGHYATLAASRGFKGLFAVVSDPVDHLCSAALFESQMDEHGNIDSHRGLNPFQIQGYGLGVMYSRAVYHAKNDGRFADFLVDGRAFGPHGKDLVIANSLSNYDSSLSEILTNLVVNTNMQMRDLGFKPYVAPALASATIPILQTIRGKWHYSATYDNGIYMGALNRTVPSNESIGYIELEDVVLPQKLQERISDVKKTLQSQLKVIYPDFFV